jgi:methylase of polypeptide subunit release factors
VIDIGAAEGYYAIGFARRLPAARVIASDLDPVARLLCWLLARRNGVGDRVSVCPGFRP